MGLAGTALKSVSWFLRSIEFCCAVIILGIFSYFLAVLSNHNLDIATWIKAVEGISGVAVLYTLSALVLVFCLGGMAFFSFIGMFLDLAFAGVFIYLAYATRNGRHSCSGTVDTPLGSGDTNGDNTVPGGSGGNMRLPSLKTSCRLETACFAVALVGLVFFLLSFFAELGMMSQRRRERAFGPSPQNNYTSGIRHKFWQRKPKGDSTYTNGGVDAQKHGPDTLPEHTTPGDMRQSYNTSTAAQAPVQNRYGLMSPPLVANQAGYPGAIGQASSNQAGYATQPTTHAAYAKQPENSSQQRYGPAGAQGYSFPQSSEEKYKTYNPPQSR